MACGVEVAGAPDLSAAERRMPRDLGVRLTHLAEPPVTPDSRPEIDFAVPLD
jgi:hypothetical protein